VSEALSFVEDWQLKLLGMSDPNHGCAWQDAKNQFVRQADFDLDVVTL
jgi:hypothetical protein